MGRKTSKLLVLSNKKPLKTTKAMWRQRGSLAVDAQPHRLAGGRPREQTSLAAGGTALSYRASCSRGQFVGGEGEGFIAEVGVEHFLEDDAAVGRQ